MQIHWIIVGTGVRKMYLDPSNFCQIVGHCGIYYWSHVNANGSNVFLILVYFES